jgi:flagellar protein FlaG
MEAVGNVKASVAQAQTPEPQSASSRPAPVEPRTAESQPPEKEPKQVDRATAEKIADAIQHFVSTMDVKLNFQVHDDTGTVMVRVVNQESGEVVREIPPSQVLDLAAKIDRMIGALFDART